MESIINYTIGTYRWCAKWIKNYIREKIYINLCYYDINIDLHKKYDCPLICIERVKLSTKSVEFINNFAQEAELGNFPSFYDFKKAMIDKDADAIAGMICVIEDGANNGIPPDFFTDLYMIVPVDIENNAFDEHKDKWLRLRKIMNFSKI